MHAKHLLSMALRYRLRPSWERLASTWCEIALSAKPAYCAAAWARLAFGIGLARVIDVAGSAR